MKMEKEFNLSKEIGNIGSAEYFHFLDNREPTKDYEEVLQVKDVKEFIRRLKESLFATREREFALECCKEVNEIIDSLAGDGLNGKEGSE